MGNQSTIVPDKLFCGIDVSAVSLAVAVQQREELLEERDFPNNANGHRLLIAWLRKRKASVRVTLEATGVYSLDLSLALNESLLRIATGASQSSTSSSCSRRTKTDPCHLWHSPVQDSLRRSEAVPGTPSRITVPSAGNDGAADGRIQ
ncbi:IS110 family transposase [Tunturiibacter gelidiferens]|uniref:IS110 family transposase n=1 Tax=Tunturiibacter gelidiferens TaxID=3069689 RepID=UPI003D9B4344